jgi:hypothetical protein
VDREVHRRTTGEATESVDMSETHISQVSKVRFTKWRAETTIRQSTAMMKFGHRSIQEKEGGERPVCRRAVGFEWSPCERKAAAHPLSKVVVIAVEGEEDRYTRPPEG